MLIPPIRTQGGRDGIAEHPRAVGLKEVSWNGEVWARGVVYCSATCPFHQTITTGDAAGEEGKTF